MASSDVFGVAIEDSVPHPTKAGSFLTKVSIHGLSPLAGAVQQFAIHQRLLADAENKCNYPASRYSLIHFLNRIRQE